MMPLGFGQTEIETAFSIINECKAAIEADPNNVEKVLEAVEKKYHLAEKEYDKMDRNDAPERYTDFYHNCWTIYDGKHIVEFTMHHINRRHPCSSDGYALLITHWILNVCPTDGTRIYQEQDW